MAKPEGKASDQLRHARWFSPDDPRSFGHLSRMMQPGYAEEEFRDRTIVGIPNTWPELNSCHGHFPRAGQGCETRGAAGRRPPGRDAVPVGG